MDAADQAAELEEMARLCAIAATQATAGINQTGDCIDCDEAINPKRLAKVPTAQRCVPCQTQYEHQRGIR